MSESAHNPELRAFEAALTSLTPAPSHIDRDQVMFRAGQASVAGRRWLWPAVAAALGSLSLTMGLLLWLRPEPAPVVRVVYVPAEPAPSPPEPSPSSTPTPEPLPLAFDPPSRPATAGNYLQFRRHVIRWGAEGLPGPPTLSEPPPEPMTPARLRDLPPGGFYASPGPIK